jgi:purine-cytosine permease-like protein
LCSRGLYVDRQPAGAPVQADRPQFIAGWLALTLTVALVVISLIKINVTNAYSGSLAWTNSSTRVTKHCPGQVLASGLCLNWFG